MYCVWFSNFFSIFRKFYQKNLKLIQLKIYSKNRFYGQFDSRGASDSVGVNNEIESFIRSKSRSWTVLSSYTKNLLVYYFIMKFCLAWQSPEPGPQVISKLKPLWIFAYLPLFVFFSEKIFIHSIFRKGLFLFIRAFLYEGFRKYFCKDCFINEWKS